MDIRIIACENRNQINEFIKSNWFSIDMVVRGEIVDMTATAGFVANDNEEIIGLVTYRIKEDKCEIMSLDSLREKQGIGTALLNKVIEAAKAENCSKVKLITTNDNINALDISRKLKPSIPLIGEFGIPLRHEIEFEMNLDR